MVQLLGMLGSDHDGERAAAALHANRLLRNAGMTWNDLLDGADRYQEGYQQGFQDAAEKAMALHQEQQEEVERLRQQMQAGGSGWMPAGIGAHQDAARACLAAPVRWTPWEVEFLESMQFRFGSLSEKQTEILGRLYNKAEYYQQARRMR